MTSSPLNNEDLYCMLLPLTEGQLILPRSCVTEVINYQIPVPQPNAPEWHLGSIAWGGRRVPLVSFEATQGRPAPSASSRTRIVVLQSLHGEAEGYVGHYGLLIQGFPHLVKVLPETLQAEDVEFLPESLILCQVKAGSERAWIPDCVQFEEQLRGLELNG